MRVKKKYTYYNFNRLYSYDSPWKFVCGGRGIGKSFGAKKKVINNFLRRGEQFIYLRRYKAELIAAQSFFADIQADGLFKDWDFRVNGLSFECAPVSSRGEKKRSWRVMGYSVALSTSAKEKSRSFPLVTTILFDEFIIEKGVIHYLANEAKVMLDFYSTVDRYQDKTTVLFLANAVSINNPYFLKWKIIPDGENEFIQTGEGGFILCHFPDSAQFASEVESSKFGRFISGTEYAEFAIGNQFSDNTDVLLQNKTSKARYQYTLETAEGAFSVWYDNFTNEYYIQSKRPLNEKVFTLEIKKMDETKTLMNINDKSMQYLRASFNTGRVMFDEAPTRNIFMEVFKK